MSYDGSLFHGWQIQTKATSVQGCLQKALKTLLGEEVTVTGAGRTDTGVNAISYCAHFDTTHDLDAGSLSYKLNAILPPSVVIHGIVPADENFHARFSATSRTYKYFLHRKKDPFMHGKSLWLNYNLDMDAMNRAASYLLGTHDFSCFEKSGGDNKTSICSVSGARWDRYVPGHVRTAGFPAEEGDYMVFTITSDRFLRNMVRAVVGTLLDIGRGRHPAEWMEEVMDSHDRCSAGESVPGNALFLVEIKYPER